MRFKPCLAAAVLASLSIWATAQQLTVSAAASLSDAFKEVAGRFESGRRPARTLGMALGLGPRGR